MTFRSKWLNWAPQNSEKMPPKWPDKSRKSPSATFATSVVGRSGEKSPGPCQCDPIPSPATVTGVEPCPQCSKTWRCPKCGGRRSCRATGGTALPGGPADLYSLPVPVGYKGLPRAQVEAAEAWLDRVGIKDLVLRKYNVLSWVRSHLQWQGQSQGPLYEAIKEEQLRLGRIIDPAGDP